MAGLKIMVIAGSSYEEALQRAKADLPGLEWESRSDVGMEELLLAVSDGAIDATLVDSTIYSVNGHYYPGSPRGSHCRPPCPWPGRFLPARTTAWSERPVRSCCWPATTGAWQNSTMLFTFLKTGWTGSVCSSFYDRYANVCLRLCRFSRMAISLRHGLALLAAMGYQESHWDPDASSYTGVRGIMMLTRRTANQLGVTDRLNPEQSIDGGARYFLRLRGRSTARRTGPTWMALAAYNLGMGHLEDVRIITENQGGDPDAWDDVNQRLDLLSKQKWYGQTRYGYARGFEAKQYVENIQRLLRNPGLDGHARPPVAAARLERRKSRPSQGDGRDFRRCL